MPDIATVALGRLADTALPRLHLLHLTQPPIIIAPSCQSPGIGWHCLVVASPTPWTSGPLTLTTKQIAAASTTIPFDRDGNPDAYAMLWQARAYRHWPGGPMLALARLCAQQLRHPGRTHIDESLLNEHAAIAKRLPNTRPPAVICLLNRLIMSGFLTHRPHTVELTLPCTDRLARS